MPSKRRNIDIPQFSFRSVGLEAELDDCITEIWLGSIDWSILSRVSLLSSRDWYSLLFKLSRFDITLLFLSVSDGDEYRWLSIINDFKKDFYCFMWEVDPFWVYEIPFESAIEKWKYRLWKFAEIGQILEVFTFKVTLYPSSLSNYILIVIRKQPFYLIFYCERFTHPITLKLTLKLRPDGPLSRLNILNIILYH